MHENIKFTLRLSDDTAAVSDVNLVRTAEAPIIDGTGAPVRMTETTEEIKNEIADWQPIFGDIEYGTDHVIYAKFIGKTVSTEFHISEIQLYLQNYSGPVTIGFNHAIVGIDKRVGIPPTDPDGDIRFPNRTQYNMSIGLEGLKNHINDLFMVDRDKFRAAQSGTMKPISSTNPLIVRTGDILNVDTWFSPADPCFTRIYTDRGQLKDAPFVDQLFMERVGEDIVVSHQGLDELKWINSRYPTIVSNSQFEAAKENLTWRPDNFKSTRGVMTDWRPCQRTYSKFYVS